MAVSYAIEKKNANLVGDLLEIGFPMYGASKYGDSALGEIFSIDSDITTCKRLLNIFVRVNNFDVFREAEYVENKKLYYNNSVMEELFEAIAKITLSQEMKGHLAEIIDAICKCTSANLSFDMD